MPVLTPVRASPPLAVSICRHLARDGRTVSMEDLLDRFVPGALRVRIAEETLEQTLTIAVRVGLLRRDDDAFVVPPEVSEGLGAASDSRVFLRDWLFRPDLTGTDPFDDIDNEKPVADLARALCWFSDMDPTGLPMYQASSAIARPHSPTVRLAEDLGVDGSIAPRDAQWNSFARWATYVGCARTRKLGAANAIVPDVYEALKDTIPQVWSAESIPLEKAFDLLAARLPFLAGGEWERRWRERASPDEPQVVKPVLAFALHRLMTEERISLTVEGDAPEWRLIFGRFRDVPSPQGPMSPSVHSYTHVRLLHHEESNL